jgi:hypothetical protein
MQIPLRVTCASCQKPATHRVRLDQSSLDWTCSGCGNVHWGFFDLDFTIGFLLLERSKFELQEEKDYSMSIVLAAAGLDSEMTRMYCKWKRIEDIKAQRVFDQEKHEQDLWPGGFIAKTYKVTKLLYPGGIETFVKSSIEFTKTITERFPSLHIGSLAEDFHKVVFKPRNAILHQGYVQFKEEDAARCCSIAGLGLDMLLAMDRAKRIAEQI